MAAYEPSCLYADTFTATASAAIVGGQTLIVTGNGTVGPATATSPACIGVAAFDAGNTDLVTYFPRGKIHISTASGAITAAARVDTGAAGTVASGAASVNNLGVALTTAADTALVTWMEI